MFIPFWWIFMLLVSHLAAFCLAFSIKLRCVLHRFTLRFAPKRTAFSIKTHCVLHHFTLQLATNSPKSGADGDVFK